MAIYKFKVTYEDHEDVYREIEIKSNQTFEHLHNAIQQSIAFDNSKAASFFISDDSWRRGQEITLKEADAKGDGPNKKPKKLMKQSKIAGFIEDPHQKILYVFDFEAHWTFCLELVKISVDEPKNIEFPRCVKTVGNSPKQYKKIQTPLPEEEDDDLEDEKNSKEKIFTSEEDYDKDTDEDEDALIEGEDEETEEDNEFGEDFNGEEYSED